MTSIVLTPTQIQKVLTENQSAPTDPVLPPDPIAPPDPKPKPPTPLPPVKPIPDPEPDAQSMRFSNVFKLAMEFGPSRRRAIIYPVTEIRIYESILSLEITLPVITGDCAISISKASAALPSHGVIVAVFSYNRGFEYPLSRTVWGTTSMEVELGVLDSNRTLFLNAKYMGDAMPWGLNIQPFAYEV